MKNKDLKYFFILAVIAVSVATYVYFNQKQVIEACFGNKDLPNLADAKILPWSDPKTWGGSLPAENSVIVIPPGKTILLNADQESGLYNK